MSASTSKKPEVVDTDAFKTTCCKCSELEKKLALWMNHNKELVTDLDKLKETNNCLKQNELSFETTRQALYIQMSDLQVTVKNQLSTINSYTNALEKEKKNVFEKESEIRILTKKLFFFSNQSIILDQILTNHRPNSKSTAELGYETTPPPKDYTPVPVVDLEAVFVPTSSMTAEPAPEKEVISQEESVKKDDLKCKLKGVVNTKEFEMTETQNKLVNQILKGLSKQISHTIDKKLGKQQVVEKKKVLNENKQASMSQRKDFDKPTRTSTSQTPLNKIFKRAENSNDTRKGSPTKVLQKVPSSNPSHHNSQITKIQTSQVRTDTRTCNYCRCEGHIAKFCSRLRANISKRKELKNRQKSTTCPKQPAQPSRSQVAQPQVQSLNVPVKVQRSKTDASKVQNSETNVLKTNKLKPNKLKTNELKSNELEVKEVNPVSPPHQNDTSILPDFQKDSKFIDVIITDESGRPKSIKAWVPIKN
jgi:hypothetical protein